MKIIILTQYFPPEVGAAQNRLYETATRLQKNGAEIKILTAMPNYPEMKIRAGYEGKFYMKENMIGMEVHRAWIYVGNNKKTLSRLFNYFSFVFTSFWVGWFKLGKADFIFCESPPLFLGISAILLKKIKRCKLIFNVADLWPEAAEKLGIIKNRTVLNLSRKLEEYLYSSSAAITGQTQGIVTNIKSRFQDKIVHWLPNGVDLSLYKVDEIQRGWREKNGFSEDDFLLIYAGTIGHIYSWDMVLEAAKITQQYPAIKWIFIGDGAAKANLVEKKEAIGLSNIFFYNPVPRSSLPEIWKSVNVLFLPLKNIELNKGVVPAKTFEAMAMKVPILLGAEGEAKKLFIDEGRAGLFVIPENTNDFVEKVLFLFNNREECKKLGENGLRYVKENFDRGLVTDKLYALLSGLK
jgi:glycosyltransferase involved in cell wall biosynthesis